MIDRERVDNVSVELISKRELLKMFAEKDYPIIYRDNSFGRGMGYADFEKLVNSIGKYTEGENMIDNTMMHETLREIADHFKGLSRHMVYTDQARLRFARYVDALEKADSLLQQKLKPYESRKKLPCPKCGTPRPETWFGCGSKSTVSIRCRACDFEITGDTEIAAIRAWNAREEG